MNTNTAQQTQQPQQPPNIDPRSFAALNELDTFLSRAPLTRAEHQQAGNLLQFIVSRLEGLQQSLTTATTELAALKAEAEKAAKSKEADAVITEVLNAQKPNK